MVSQTRPPHLATGMCQAPASPGASPASGTTVTRSGNTALGLVMPGVSFS